MKYLLDTCTLIYILNGESHLFSPKIQKIFKSTASQYTVSTVSFWEISIKFSIGKLELKKPGMWIIDRVSETGGQLLSIQPEHALFIAQLPSHHKDPFDRLLIAQAITENLKIITPDQNFKKYPVDVVW